MILRPFALKFGGESCILSVIKTNGMENMKVIGIIPSRFGSSRFPGKPLAILAGKPLVAWVVEAVKKAIARK